MMTPNMICFTTDMRLRDDGGGVLPTAPWRLKALEGKTLRKIDGSVQERYNSSTLAIELRLSCTNPSIDIVGLVQERCNSSTLAMELGLSCTNPSICHICMVCISRCQRCLSWLVPRSAETPLVKGTVIFMWKIFVGWRHCQNVSRFQ